MKLLSAFITTEDTPSISNRNKNRKKLMPFVLLTKDEFMVRPFGQLQENGSYDYVLGCTPTSYFRLQFLAEIDQKNFIQKQNYFLRRATFKAAGRTLLHTSSKSGTQRS